LKLGAGDADITLTKAPGTGKLQPAEGCKDQVVVQSGAWLVDERVYGRSCGEVHDFGFGWRRGYDDQKDVMIWRGRLGRTSLALRFEAPRRSSLALRQLFVYSAYRVTNCLDRSRRSVVDRAANRARNRGESGKSRR
jgi:hypothetical protein